MTSICISRHLDVKFCFFCTRQTWDFFENVLAGLENLVENFYDRLKNRKCRKENLAGSLAEIHHAFPPKQWLSHDGVSESLNSHIKAQLDFLIMLGRLHGFIKCLGKKFQKNKSSPRGNFCESCKNLCSGNRFRETLVVIL